MIPPPLTSGHLIVHLLLSPLSWCLVSALAYAALRRREGGLLRGLAVLIWLVSVLLMTPLGANALLGGMEKAASRAVALACQIERPPSAGSAALKASARSGILLTGGFDRPALSADDLAALTPASYVRTVHAARLYQQGRISRLLITGGSDGDVPESAVLAELAQRLGVPASRIDIEPIALSTWDNARLVKSSWPGLSNGPQPLLITTALHTPRSLLAFSAAGLSTCPAPTDWRHIPLTWSPGYFLPQQTALEKTEETLHELVGYASYWWRQRHPPTLPADPQPPR